MRYEKGGSAVSMKRGTSIVVAGSFGCERAQPCSEAPRELQVESSPPWTCPSFPNLLSKSPLMHAVFELIGQVARTKTTVLIEGESGTGKEEVARAIHHASPGRSGPLVATCCATFPDGLVESELFGHEAGSYTGAVRRRLGRIELADSGTLFLDEVGDIPPGIQAKLLRVLQERCFERVGGSESIEVDLRVIAATNRPLAELVKKRLFREDLFYRLNVVKIHLPPLRDRPEDIPLLAAHFALKCANPASQPKSITPDAMDVLLRSRWPGNVRQLENAVARASVLTRDEFIREGDLPSELLEDSVPTSPHGIDLSRPLADQLRERREAFEQAYLRKALRKTHGHISHTARVCGLSRRAILNKLTRYKIDKSAFIER